MAQLCAVCFRPKHEIVKFDNGMAFVTCVECPPDKIFSTGQRYCACCKCETPNPFSQHDMQFFGDGNGVWTDEDTARLLEYADSE